MFPPGASPPDPSSSHIARFLYLATWTAIQPLLLPLRKEVIQPHLPIRLPCYDFTPVTGPAFGCPSPSGFGHRLRAFPAPMV